MPGVGVDRHEQELVDEVRADVDDLHLGLPVGQRDDITGSDYCSQNVRVRLTAFGVRRSAFGVRRSAFGE